METNKVKVFCEGNEALFKAIFNAYIKRDGAERLLEMICRTDFFTAPASTKYHSNFEGGLCFHSIVVWQVCLDQINLLAKKKGFEIFSIIEQAMLGQDLNNEELAKINKALSIVLGSKITLESLAITTLCHDLVKMNLYERYKKDKYDPKNPLANSRGWVEAYAYKKRDDCFILGEHGTNSWYLVNTCIKLSYEEVLAIENHMSMSDRGQPLPASSGAYSSSKLALYLHIADMIATFDIERKENL